MNKGDKVTYQQFQKGIIKSVKSPAQVYVVYQCAGNWDRFEEYTGVLTNMVDLKEGWAN